MYFMQAGPKNPNNALAGSVDFLHLFGLVSLGFVSPSARQTDAQMVRALRARLVAAP